jgi:hypothetical protein
LHAAGRASDFRVEFKSSKIIVSIETDILQYDLGITLLDSNISRLYSGGGVYRMYRSWPLNLVLKNDIEQSERRSN